MHVVHWKKQAINDLIKIGQFIARDSPAHAKKMIERIQGKLQPLATYPRLGRPGHKRGTYELIAHEHYVIIYRVSATEVEILRIKHTARRWPAK
ncbi:type II toxin-antitoxin system RelE/ParE family toxin [Massilia atriviolacea]|uniref:Type II toxin-antitoxin system RelE/ParE family toxin n=1 Tax=Massilia atriviolacea TaxID=2495579 RepID=A0A430HDV6_9BURK|nr:type II toxin-antitoxin system RelE/ParE family toxin [Massilia atriviolacea]RSZ55689.1 type II toxin-antitoxin system RelE/ParE family toxin [Massilia atriviolacea]